MKKVIITMDEKGQFSVNGSGIGSIEILGFLEFAKSTVLKDIMQPGKPNFKKEVDGKPDTDVPKYEKDYETPTTLGRSDTNTTQSDEQG